MITSWIVPDYFASSEILLPPLRTVINGRRVLYSLVFSTRFYYEKNSTAIGQQMQHVSLGYLSFIGFRTVVSTLFLGDNPPQLDFKYLGTIFVFNNVRKYNT